jgi:energy-coupling factor transporter ATP-binding protein EcfA2
MDEADEPDTGAPEATAPAPAVITATGLGLDGEHGPLFADVDLKITKGLNVVQMPGGPGQLTLLLTLAGRMKPTRGELVVLGDTDPSAIRRHCAIAAFDTVDELDEMVTVQTILSEQQRWLAPFFSRVPENDPTRIAHVFGDVPVPAPGTFVVALSDLELFLLRVTLASLSNRPVLVVGDLEQVRDNERRETAVARLGALAAECTVVVGVTNPLGPDAPAHELHDQRVLVGGD